MMRLGIAYYPEHHRPGDWPLHYEKMRAAGITRIRVGEFAWSTIQPRKGEYHWEWLDQSIELAARYGIEVLLCTPTACPPIWLVEEHPEVLPVDRMGRRSLFGARQHRCYNAPAYIEHSRLIVQALAERYGQHPNVVAWQLDNELGGEQKRCYCSFCRHAFQQYLMQRYGTIEALNERWGNHFWSQDYQIWEQIPVPMQFASDLPMKHHPSLELEFSRFSSDSIVSYSRMQVAILRAHTLNRPITTNAFMFKWGDNLNWYDLFREMDVASIDIYTEQPHEVAFYADLCRGIKGDGCWVLEYASEFGGLRSAMNLLDGLDCRWLFLFKLNAVPAGQEQSMQSLLTITGETTPNYEVVRDWATQASLLARSRSRRSRSPVGMLYHFDSSWAYSIAEWSPNGEGVPRYPRYLCDVVYRSLFEEGFPVRFVGAAEDMQGCQAMVLPWQIVYDADLERSLIQFVQEGGRLIVTSDLFHKNADNAYLTHVPQIYRVLLGWEANDLMVPGSGPILRTQKAGKGQTWMVKPDATLQQWKEVLRQLCECAEPRAVDG